MTAINASIYLQLFLKLNLFFFSTATVLISAAYFFFSYRVPEVKQAYNTVNLIFKSINIVCYMCSFIFFAISFYFFFRLIEAYKIEVNAPSTFAYCNQYGLQIFAYRFEIDLFGFILLLLAYVVGFLALLTLDTRLASINFNFFIYFNFFVIFVFLFVISNDVILFFFFYELLVLPSFFFVYFVSYSKKAIQASLYFVI
jgi:formate hydrogenlyase subunit 3/multisubunit Na+/H+ antiporter MnhD subunit